MPGIDLSRQFYSEAVSPVLASRFPELPYSAALLGRGSEVLGFDDEMSRDHNWEPRVLLFLTQQDNARRGDAVDAALRESLPTRFRDYATDYSIVTLQGYVGQHLEVDIDGAIGPRDWLTFPEQKLLMITAGAVYHDQIGLHALRERFAYYPRDVWLYLLAAGWWRIHPEINLVGRAGSAGDELGSAIIGSQLVHDIMSLCFLMERRYAPYSKWFATAFARLNCARDLTPILTDVIHADTWRKREDALTAAYEQVAAMHSASKLTTPVSTEVEQIWNRPFKVTWADFPGLLSALIEDPDVREIAERWPNGGVDRFRDMLMRPGERSRLLRLFE